MPAFTPPPAAPQRGDRATFSTRMDAFLSWLVALIPQLNTFIANLNARDLGGANTFIYTFDTATADGDPGAGKLRLDTATQNNANVLRLDTATGGGVDISDFLASLAAGTSNIKGSVRLQRVNDPAAWILFDVTSVPAGTGYRNLAVIARSSSGPSPFANGDSIAVFVNRNGDKGDSGGTPTQAEIRAAVGTMPIANGGTGATTAAAARANLGAMDVTTPVMVRNAGNYTAGTLHQSGSLPNIAAINAASWDLAPITVTNDGNASASAVICFYRTGGAYAAFFGLDTDNRWKVGGRSMGNAAYEIYHQGNFNPASYALLSGANFWGNISAPVVTQTSDERKKTNWVELTDEQLDMLASMTKAGIFDWADGSGSSAGGSAQQIQAIVPQVVYKDSKGILSVDYGGLNFAIIQATLRRLKQKGVL